MNEQNQTTCTKCNSIFIQKQGVYSSFLICKTCLDVKRIQHDHSIWCLNPNIIVVKKTYDGNAIYAYEQCSSCGLKIRGPISKKGLEINLLPTFNEALSRSINDEIYKEYFVIQAELGDIKKSVFFEKYNQYLNGNTWKDKRHRVLKRDDYLCQACLRNNATEVHHKTYKHVFNEPLFELVAVCKSCHEKITRMDSEKNKLYGGPGNSFF